MASEQKRKERKVLITKALLLGYQITFMPDVAAWGLTLPDGTPHMYAGVAWGQVNRWPNVVAFDAPWLAAQKALELAGVTLHETNVRRDKGIGSSKSWKLRSGRNLRGRFKSLLEGSGSF